MQEKMYLRLLFQILIAEALLWHSISANSIRLRRQISSQNSNYRILGPAEAVQSSSSVSSEAKVYIPPHAVAPVPSSQSSSIQNAYRPQLYVPSSNEYKQLISSSQTQSVQYHPPNNPQPLQFRHNVAAQPSSQISHNQNDYNLPQRYSYSQSSAQSLPVQSSSSVINNQQPSLISLPIQHDHRQSHTYVRDHSGLPQYNPPAESYNPLSKAVGSSHHPAQAIHKAPASEIQADKGTLAKDKDAQNDEYIVYYYYYYDNDTTPNNLSLNFDDIPSLESYDTDKTGKEQEKSASSRTLAANVNSLTSHVQDNNRKIVDINESSQPRSVSGIDHKDSFRSDKSLSHPNEANPHLVKHVSNVYRYGPQEVPLHPHLPNLLVTETSTPAKSDDDLTSNLLVANNPTISSLSSSSGSVLQDGSSINRGNDNDNIVEETLNEKNDEGKLEDTTTSTTSTEPPTTTEIPTTTTTEKSRRRPGTGGRRRFNPSSSFSSNRARQPSVRSTTSTTTTTTVAPASSSTRSSFRGSNRARPRTSISNNRSRPTFNRISPSSNTGDQAKNDVSSTTTSTTTTTSRPRFTTSASRRFSSNRNRSPVSLRSSTTSTTTSSPVRSRTTSRPRPNLVTRNRPPRPGFFRPRVTANEPQEPETTTAEQEPIITEDHSSSDTSSEEEASALENDSEEGSEENEETSNEEAEITTTTEKSRFSALFRPRNRNPLGNRPRPVVRGPPSRSR